LKHPRAMRRSTKPPMSGNGNTTRAHTSLSSMNGKPARNLRNGGSHEWEAGLGAVPVAPPPCFGTELRLSDPENHERNPGKHDSCPIPARGNQRVDAPTMPRRPTIRRFSAPSPRAQPASPPTRATGVAPHARRAKLPPAQRSYDLRHPP
jgi:hypothetical protein